MRLLSTALLLTLAGCTFVSKEDLEERQAWWSGVSAEANQSCGLRGDGSVDCWGALDADFDDGDTSWELANGVDAGERFACVLLDSETVHCFGDEAEPGLVEATPEDAGWKAVSGGVHHACAIGGDHRVTCWGLDDEVMHEIPSDEFGQIDVGEGFACGVTDSTGEVLCWGDDAGLGRVDDSPAKDPWWYQVSAGYGFACGVADGCTTQCWGDAVPTVPTTACWDEVHVGMYHACFRDSWGMVECTGENQDGQLQVPDDEDVWEAIDLGANHSCGLTEEGSIRCWGNDDSGQATL